MRNTNLKYFRVWAKQQPFYQPYVNGNFAAQREFDRHCKFINQAALCFDHWEKIVKNLTDATFTAIDARTFSVEYFSHAISYDWCVEYNQKVGNKGKSKEQLYTPAQIEDIFQYILASGVLDEADSHTAASIGGQIQRKLVRHCRRRR